jgi:catechol 2,3-dioxygenase-like lactoylglutathione lyase family enzyme
MFERFSHVMLYAHDLHRAVDWYTKVLGCRVDFLAGDTHASLTEPDTGQRIDLHPISTGAGNAGLGAIPYFSVKRIDDAVLTLRSRNVMVSDPKSETGNARCATFSDSEGNTLGLEESRRVH